MINIIQLINLQSNKPHDMIIEGSKKNTKLMFHKIDPKRLDINPHYNLAEFEHFQKEHHNKFFAGTKYILSFWYEGKIAGFLGTYRLGEPIKDKIFDEGSKRERARYLFPDMSEINFLNEYKNRLFIKWTNPSANYGRWIGEEKYEIHSLKPSKENNIGPVPRYYYTIRLQFPILQRMFEFPVDNEDWRYYLSSRAGVYLILDISTGEQYIGSAYGEEGFWGRWSNYASTGHGGNVDLKNRDYCLFQFSILWETLITTSKNAVIDVESSIKENLGTRVHGLNNN